LVRLGARALRRARHRVGLRDADEMARAGPRGDEGAVEGALHAQADVFVRPAWLGYDAAEQARANRREVRRAAHPVRPRSPLRADEAATRHRVRADRWRWCGHAQREWLELYSAGR